jgi:hypothetical protein
MSRETRWETALHESGHAIASLTLGGKCLGLALLDDGDSGCCQSGDLDATRTAFMVACGPEAERLAESFPVPDVPIEQMIVTVDEIESLPVFETSPLLACQMVRTADTRKRFSSDDRQLALWAISGNEADPESWARRVEFARYVAEGLVTKNAETIVRVATALFTKTSLSGPEVTAIFQGSKP